MPRRATLQRTFSNGRDGDNQPTALLPSTRRLQRRLPSHQFVSIARPAQEHLQNQIRGVGGRCNQVSMPDADFLVNRQRHYPAVLDLEATHPRFGHVSFRPFANGVIDAWRRMIRFSLY